MTTKLTLIIKELPNNMFDIEMDLEGNGKVALILAALDQAKGNISEKTKHIIIDKRITSAQQKNLLISHILAR